MKFCGKRTCTKSCMTTAIYLQHNFHSPNCRVLQNHKNHIPHISKSWKYSISENFEYVTWKTAIVRFTEMHVPLIFVTKWIVQAHGWLCGFSWDWQAFMRHAVIVYGPALLMEWPLVPYCYAIRRGVSVWRRKILSGARAWWRRCEVMLPLNRNLASPTGSKPMRLGVQATLHHSRNLSSAFFY